MMKQHCSTHAIRSTLDKWTILNMSGAITGRCPISINNSHVCSMARSNALYYTASPQLLHRVRNKSPPLDTECILYSVPNVTEHDDHIFYSFIQNRTCVCTQKTDTHNEQIEMHTHTSTCVPTVHHVRV